MKVSLYGKKIIKEKFKKCEIPNLLNYLEEKCFGEETKLKKILLVNSFQLKKIRKLSKIGYGNFAKLRNENFNISFLDEQTSKVLFAILDSERWAELFFLILKSYPFNSISENCRLIENFNQYYFSNNIWQKLIDSFRMISQLKIGNIFKKIEIEKIESAHKQLVELINLKKNEKKDKALKKRYENLKIFYEEKQKNENFSVLIPKTYKDFLIEGRELSHCIVSYVDKFIDKESIILFLRKNKNLKKPFFSIEIKKEKLIQIHGKCNCHFKTAEKDAQEYLREYLKNRNIKINEKF